MVKSAEHRRLELYEKKRNALNERRARDEKEKVIIGVMMFLSVAMVLLFLHGIVADLTTGKGVFFMLKCMGCFVVFALPLLIWNSCRYIRYINKRRKEAEFYHFDQNEAKFDDGLEDLIDKMEEASPQLELNGSDVATVSGYEAEDGVFFSRNDCTSSCDINSLYNRSL